MGTDCPRAWLGFFLAVSTSASAAPLSFRAAITIAQERAPVVRAADRAASALTHAADVANPFLLMPAQLQFTAGARHFEGGIAPGFETQAQFQQPIPLRPVGSTRKQSMTAAQRFAAGRANEARHVVAERTAHAWLGVLFAEKTLVLHTRALDEARNITALARVRVAKGVASPNETALALADEAMAETEQLDAEGQLTEAKLALGSILGVDAASFTLDDHDAPIDTPCPTVDAALTVMRQTHPSVLRAHGHAESLAGDAAYIDALHGVSLGIGFVAARDGTGELLSSALVTIPFPWSTPGHADTLRVQSENDEAVAAHAFEADALTRDVRVAIHDHEHTRATLAAARRAVTALQDAYRIARALVDRGASDLTIAALARQRLIAGEDRALHAEAQVFHGNVRLLAAQGILSEAVTR